MTRRSVLIVAPEDDLHAQAVAALLRRDFDVEATIWDVGNFPSHHTLSLELAKESVNFSIDLGNGRRYDLDSLLSVWWRRPSRFRISDDVSDPKVRQFCLRESEVFFKGALQAANVPIINPIGVGTYAAYKPVQLACAKKVGLAS